MKLTPVLPENQADLNALAHQLVEAVQEQQQQLAALHQQLRRQDARLRGIPEISTPQAEDAGPAPI